MKLTMIMAITADGMIARHNNHFPDWTCREDKKMFKAITQEAGVVIFGSRTYDTIGKALKGRLNVIVTRHPERYTPLEDQLFYSDSPKQLMDDLVLRGYDEAVLAGGATINDLFIKEQLVDEIILTISPKLFGKGMTLFSEPLDLDLKLISFQQIDPDTLVIKYGIKY